MQKGNASFNEKELPQELVQQTKSALAETAMNAGPTAEDMALDRELERMSRENEPEYLPDDKRENILTKFDDRPDFLDVDPAKNFSQLQEFTDMAKSVGVGAIEAEWPVIKYYVKTMTQEQFNKIGYFIYHNVRVYLAGQGMKTKLKEEREENRVGGVIYFKSEPKKEVAK